MPGVISANENTPMPIKRIAGILNISEALVKHCMEKFKQSRRIMIDAAGLIHIINWERYQYSSYDRVKRHRDKQRENK